MVCGNGLYRAEDNQSVQSLYKGSGQGKRDSGSTSGLETRILTQGTCVSLCAYCYLKTCQTGRKLWVWVARGG